jgi:hypothetical protein
MGGLPVTIRLLDPPLHEFLPHTEEEIARVAQAMGADPKKLADRADFLRRADAGDPGAVMVTAKSPVFSSLRSAAAATAPNLAAS